MAFHHLTEWLYAHTIVRAGSLGTAGFLALSFASVVGASLLASWLIHRHAPTAGGGGVMPTKIAFWRDFGVIPPRTALVKFFGSALTLGGGVSMGPEGPAVQMGAAGASTLGNWLGVAKQDRRVLCAGGAAAAIAAAFNAPLAAILFVLEEIIGDLNSRLIGGILLASVMGALVAHALIGPQPAYQVAPLDEPSWHAALLCLLAAVVGTVAGVLFQKGAMGLRRRLRAWRAPFPDWMKPVVGAAASWAVASGAFLACGRLGVFGIGYGDVTVAVAGGLGLGASLLLLAGKLAATTFAVGASGCGGIFAPSYFIGAMSGSAVAAVAARFLALPASDASAIVMIGMCACLGAVIRAPLTCVLLIFEVTHQFSIIPLALLATLVSQLLARRLQPQGMYEEMLLQDGQVPEHILPPRDYSRWREMRVGTLARYDPVCARSLDPAALRTLLAAHPYARFPALDAEGRVSGVLLRGDALTALERNAPPTVRRAVWASPADTLAAAQARLLESEGDLLCVGNAETRNLEGVLTLHDFLRAQQRLTDEAAE